MKEKSKGIPSIKNIVIVTTRTPYNYYKNGLNNYQALKGNSVPKNNDDIVQEQFKDCDIVQEEVKVNTLELPSPPKKKRGRPRKADIEAKKNRGKVGRPVGDAGRIKEFKARLLATSGDKVISKIIEVAMDDGHSGQLAALKMCMDRVLPLSYFEKEKGASGTPQISINISGMGDTVNIAGKEDVIDV